MVKKADIKKSAPVSKEKTEIKKPIPISKGNGMTNQLTVDKRLDFCKKVVISTQYELNYVSIRRKIQKFNLPKIVIPKISLPKFNLWQKYCIWFNKKFNGGK